MKHAENELKKKKEQEQKLPEPANPFFKVEESKQKEIKPEKIPVAPSAIFKSGLMTSVPKIEKEARERHEKSVEIEYKSIKQGSVSDALFEIPSGYKKIDIPQMPR